MIIGQYKKENSFEKRKSESNNVRIKYPNRIPIIIEVFSKSDIKLDKFKYLVPFDFVIAQLLCIIKKRINMTSETALFIFINNLVPPATITIGTLYKENRDKDGFMYITISLENTFGYLKKMKF